MKKIVCAFGMALMGLSLFAYDIAGNTAVKGGAKKVLKTDFSIVSKFGEYFRTPSTKVAYTYDANGKISDTTELTARDAIVNKITYSYDSNGKLVERVGFDSDNEQIWKAVLTYKNGQLADESE